MGVTMSGTTQGGVAHGVIGVAVHTKRTRTGGTRAKGTNSEAEVNRQNPVILFLRDERAVIIRVIKKMIPQLMPLRGPVGMLGAPREPGGIRGSFTPVPQNVLNVIDQAT